MHTVADQTGRRQKTLGFVEYRMRCRDGEVRWVREYCHFLHTQAYGDLYFAFLYDVTQRRQFAQQEKRRQEIIGAMSAEYNSIYYVDLNNDRMEPIVLRNPTSLAMTVAVSRGYSCARETFVRDYVHEADRECYLAASDPWYMLERLRKTDHYLVNFRRYDPNRRLEYLQMVVSRAAEGMPADCIVMGFRTVTDTIVSERLAEHRVTTDLIMRAVSGDVLILLEMDPWTGRGRKFIPSDDPGAEPDWILMPSFSTLLQENLQYRVIPTDRDRVNQEARALFAEKNILPGKSGAITFSADMGTGVHKIQARYIYREGPTGQLRLFAGIRDLTPDAQTI